MQDKQWKKIQTISIGWIPSDPTPFENIYDPKYTFQFICESGITQLKDKFVEIILQASKEIELSKSVD